MSEQSKKDPNNYFTYVVGTLLANSIMLLRVIVIVLLFNAALITTLFLPAILMFIGLAGCMGYFYIKGKNAVKNAKVSLEEKVESPFSILPALKF
jgi:uncharacterized membrane protein (DUF4010 family)